jgi:hypothetical protein
MEIRRQKNAHRVTAPTFHTAHQQPEILDAIERDRITVQVNLKDIIVGSCCWLMALLFVVIIVMGKN